MCPSAPSPPPAPADRPPPRLSPFPRALSPESSLELLPRRLERRRQKALDHLPNPLWLRIRHLQIDLGEFRLTVGAQVFVAEAAHDLEIFVEARDHQYLLE